MTGTDLGLNGEPVSFLGAYVKNVNMNLGLSTSPSTLSLTLAEDPDKGIFFEEPELGSFHVINVGSRFSFGGVITKYERDIRELGGRLIRVNMSDPREIMRSIPVILGPGTSTIAQTINDTTECSILDIYSAFNQAGGIINVSQWNEAGLFYTHLVSALNGDNIRIGDALIPIPQQIAKAFGERYRFNLNEINNRVFDEYRINTNLVPISNIIEDLSQKFAFDWFIESERGADDVIDVTIRIIDRSTENIEVSLQSFLDAHPDRVISASSGVELRNDVACVALLGAPVEQLLRVTIEGQANEPIDLTSESGSNAYVMVEEEMRVVIAGRHQWEMWLGAQVGPVPTGVVVDASGNRMLVIDEEAGFSGRGYSRYGGGLNDFDINPIINVRAQGDLENLVVDHPNIPKNPLRTPLYLTGAKYANSGKIYQKLKSHAEKSYGKRWVHAAISDEIIETAWTRDAVTGGGVFGSSAEFGPNDPNEFFRQADGRTRAYVEFTNAAAGGAFSLGLNNLTNLFGDQSVFRNVTVFGQNYVTNFPGQPGQIGDVLTLELADNFNPITAVVTELDKSDYIYNQSVVSAPSTRTSLYVAATTDKDGIIKIDAPVMEPKMDPLELLRRIRNKLGAPSGNNAQAQRQAAEEQRKARLRAAINNAKAEAAQKQAAGVAGANEDVLNQKTTEEIMTSIDENDGQRKERQYPPSQTYVRNSNKARKDADGNSYVPDKRVPQKFKKVFGNFMFSMNVRAYQPDYAYIPVRSRYNRYGPVFSKDLGPEAQGQVQIIQDDGFAPWEFGGVSLMLAAMQLKVDNASSIQKKVFSADISVEGFPQYNIGEAIDLNSNISDITISFSDNGVNTTYRLQSFLRRFGEFTKEDWARLALYANTGALKLTPNQQANFMESSRFRVMKQMTAGGGFPTRSTGGAADLG